MKCDNKACIYWQDKKCTLDGISIDYRGQCGECVIYEKYETEVPEYYTDYRTSLNE